jgi:hypothetical protein
VVSVLTPAETLIAARRLAGARPHLAAVAGIVHREDLWRLCRDELTGVDVRADCWDIRGRWFGVVVVATPRLGALGARRNNSMARGRDLDRTARNAVTGVDQRRIVADMLLSFRFSGALSFREHSSGKDANSPAHAHRRC